MFTLSKTGGGYKRLFEWCGVAERGVGVRAEVRFVHAVIAGGSVKFLPMV